MNDECIMFPILGSEWVPVEGGAGSGSAELVFPRASVGDAGAYRCVAKSEAGSFLAEVATVVARELVLFLLAQL